MESSSFDLSTYRFGQPTVSGLTPVHSFDNIVNQAAPLPQSNGTGPSIAFSQQFDSHNSPTMSVHRSASRKKTLMSPLTTPQFLTWRLDPDESLSDWTLTVASIASLDQKKNERENANEDRNQESTGRGITSSFFRAHGVDHPTKKYFVHRTQLAVGPRKSEYFAKLFRNKQKKGSKANGTRIELRPCAANAFPSMLDFMYSPPGSPVDVTTDSAVALRHLGTCFGIRELFDSVTEFIKDDLCTDTAATYLMEAASFRHEKLFDVSRKVCSENFEVIKFSQIVILSADLFEKVILSDELVCSSEVLSSRVASYCRCRPGAVDVDMLKRITCSSKMPRIAPEASLFFLHLLSEIDGDEESVSTSAPSKTQDLYKRCLVASAEIVRMAVETKQASPSKKSIDSRPKRIAVKEYNSLSAATKVDLLEHALSDSPTLDELMELDIARKESTKKHAHDSAKRLQELEAEMLRMRRSYEKKLTLLQATVDAQEQEIQSYATELSKFSRVPNAFRAPSQLPECTFQGKPKFDEYGSSIYGEIPPSAMPIFGRQTRDGWVYREDQLLNDGRQVHALWPMYFYKGDA